MKTTKYTIIIEHIQKYSAYCPDLPGVAAAAETEEETVELMKEAIEFHMEGLREEKMDCSEAAYVDSQYEYLQKHKSDGITLEELKRSRAGLSQIKHIRSPIRLLPMQS